MSDSILQVDKIIDKSATSNKELAQYSSGNWSWGSGVPQHTIIQVVTNQTNAYVQANSGNSSSPTWFDGITCQITPSAGTKCIIMLNCILGSNAASGYCMFRLGKTVDATVANFDLASNPTNNPWINVSMSSDILPIVMTRVIYDTHSGDGSTTITYKAQIARQNLKGNRMPATRELDYNISLNHMMMTENGSLDL